MRPERELVFPRGRGEGRNEFSVELLRMGRMTFNIGREREDLQVIGQNKQDIVISGILHDIITEKQ